MTPGKPELYFEMLTAYRMSLRPIARQLMEKFGSDNYHYFRQAGKKDEDVPEEIRMQVDNRIIDLTGETYEIEKWERKRFWKELADRHKEAFGYPRKMMFPDQEKKTSLITSIAWAWRPSSILKNLTLPPSKIDEQCRAEQFRQLAFLLPCADELREDWVLAYTNILEELNDYLEKNFFIGKIGETKDVNIFSYHMPGTNKLMGWSNRYPDPRFVGEFWVKRLTYPVREVAIRDAFGEITQKAKVLYDPDEKSFGSRVTKDLHRSKKAAEEAEKAAENITEAPKPKKKIETLPYGEDKYRVRLVVIGGGHQLRDVVTDYFDMIIKRKYGRKNVIDEKEPDKFPCNRKKINAGIRRPIEVNFLSLEDYITQEYEIGEFDEQKHMHNGRGWPLYKLDQVAYLAEDLWPPRIFNINMIPATELSSFEHANRLARVQRIVPSPFDLVGDHSR